MKHLFVPYEIAKELNELIPLEFEEQCIAYFNSEGMIVQKCYGSQVFKNRNEIPAPLYQQAIDLFREKHNIYIELTQDFYTTGVNYLWQILIYDKEDKTCYDKRSTGLYGDNAEYETYYSSLTQAINEAIKIIKG